MKLHSFYTGKISNKEETTYRIKENVHQTTQIMRDDHLICTWNPDNYSGPHPVGCNSQMNHLRPSENMDIYITICNSGEITVMK